MNRFWMLVLALALVLLATGCSTSVSRNVLGIATVDNKIILKRTTTTVKTNFVGANSFNAEDEYFMCTLANGKEVDCVPVVIRLPKGS